MTECVPVVDVAAEESSGGEVVLVLVDPCPYCGRHHVHGVASAGGVVSAHCQHNPGSYELRLAGER